MSRSSCAILSLRVGRSFSRISVGKIHLSFSRGLCGSHGLVTASLVYSAADFSGFARGSMVDVLLLHPCFNTFSRGFLAASRRNIQGGDFSLFALCSTAFLIVANGIFSPLCRRFTFVSARSFEAEKVVAQVGVVGDIAARHIGDGGALVLVNAHDRRCSPKTYRRGHLFIFHDGLYNPDG